MRRSINALICAVAVIAMGMVPVATAELPDHDDDTFTWLVNDAEDDAAGGEGIPGAFAQLACTLMAGEPSTSTSPCEALSYEIGHTDTHVFFRWNMATLEFAQTGEDFTLLFDQGFRGDHPENSEYNRNFEFVIGVDPETAWVESASARVGAEGEEEDWTDKLPEPDVDPEAGTLTVALPLELLETRVGMEKGTLVAERFNVTRAPVVTVINEQCSDYGGPIPECLAGTDGFEADKIDGAPAQENTTYWIYPVGDLSPYVLDEDVSGETVTIELNMARPSWETHHYTWDASLFSGFTIDHEVDLKGGTVDITMTGPEDEVFYESLDVSDDDAATVEDLEPGQEWTLNVEMTEWVEGNITINLAGIEFVPETEGEGEGEHENHENGDGDENSNATDGADIDDNDTPGPGIVLLLAALAGLLGLTRRRRST